MKPDRITICFPVELGPSSLAARFLAASIRHFLPPSVEVNAFKTPHSPDLSSNTLDFFYDIDIEVKILSPKFYYRNPISSLRQMDILSNNFDNTVIVMETCHMFLRHMDLLNLFPSPDMILALASQDRYRIKKTNFFLNKKATPDILDIVDRIDNLDHQYDPSIVAFNSGNGSIESLIDEAIKVIGFCANDDAKGKTFQLAINSLALKSEAAVATLPRSWGLLPHAAASAGILRYERFLSAAASSSVKNVISDICDELAEASVDLLGELTRGDISVLR